MSIVILLNFNECLYCFIWHWNLHLFEIIFLALAFVDRAVYMIPHFKKQHHTSFLNKQQLFPIRIFDVSKKNLIGWVYFNLFEPWE